MFSNALVYLVLALATACSALPNSLHEADVSRSPLTPRTVSPDGSCGDPLAYICTAGNCCSSFGYCGSNDSFCGQGCQSGFGTCTSTPPPPPPSEGSCGGVAGKSCMAGNCCSKYGFCGNTPDYCSLGCQPLFGTCTVRPTSPDGSCGGTNGYICKPGNCCSKYGYCGSDDSFCTTGCQSAFGICR